LVAWLLVDPRGQAALNRTKATVSEAGREAGDSLSQQAQEWNLKSVDIKKELAETGKVVRRKAETAGQAISDATLDGRITARIKTRLLASDLPGLGITVDTTAGVVTLAGRVRSTEEVSKAMALALETEGVKEVVSTLQVLPEEKK
jgi:osmotically-inducible protein OsmY